MVVGVGELVEGGRAPPRAAAARSTRSSVKAGTQRSVTAEIAPSAPSPTRAARSSVGVGVLAELARRCRRRGPARCASTWAEMLRSGRRCRGCRSRSRRRASGGRCRRGSPSPGRAGRSCLVEVGEDGAAPDLDQAAARGRRRSRRSSAPSVDHRAVGQRRLGERVAGAGDLDAAGPARPRRSRRRSSPRGSGGAGSAAAGSAARPTSSSTVSATHPPRRPTLATTAPRSAPGLATIRSGTAPSPEGWQSG